MNLDDLTIGEARKLAQMFAGQSTPKEPPPSTEGRYVVVCTYNFGPYMITHEDGTTLAAIPGAGEIISPRSVTTDLSRAARFETWSAASDASQNFGPEWSVEEV